MSSNPSGQGSSGAIPRGLVNRRGSVIKPSERLPSLRTRDLTLGGIPKKSFKPNIPVRKDRSKDDGKEKGDAASSSSSSPVVSKSRDGPRGDRSRGRGRGRGRGKVEYIQSHSSIFEGGPTERLNSRPTSSVFERPSFGGGGGGGDGRSSSRGGKGGGKKGVGQTGDFVGGDDRLRELVRDDFISDLEDSSVDDQYQPVSLPMAKPPKAVVKEVTTRERKPVIKDESDDDDDESEVKMETDDLPDVKVKVKTEPVDMEVDLPDEKKFDKTSITPPPPVTSLPEEDKFSTGRPTCPSLFMKSRKSEGEPLFFQLPDTLPGLPIAEEEEEDRKPVISGGSVQNSKNSTKKRPCTLKDLPEGFLGKLQVLKSGKTRLVLTNGVTLDVTMGTPCGFLQDLVSVRIRDGEDETSEMLTLGHIKHRIICTPNFESLLAMPP
ncbi:DNA-directed RNA polymerase III subunit RPC4-like [Diadema antillarum]|uniref:DNA-directed RNA polymerase III subunit RPC4-like n=1 Tax=Diadema antillarum TaxID=105358 RepID=UPI003A8BC963